MNNIIKLEGAEFNTLHILSFNSEKEFIENTINTAYFHLDTKAKTELLKSVWRIAQKFNDNITVKTTPAKKK